MARFGKSVGGTVRRGQISIEFAVLVCVLLVLLLATIYYNSTMYLQMSSTESYNDAQQISDQVASEINLGLKAGDGYVRSFSLPLKVTDKYEYAITVEGYLVRVSWSQGATQAVVLSDEIVGDLESGENTIRNINGTIVAN